MIQNMQFKFNYTYHQMIFFLQNLSSNDCEEQKLNR